ncbi:zf-TFIIB domain-containing protein [Myceligenerans halotolerans]
MQCPIDQANLVMSERKGVEIDYCPQCRGVWLDRGELDKIIDRSIDAEIAAENARPQAVPGLPQPPVPAAVPQARPAVPQPQYRDDRGYDGDRYDDRRRDHYDPRYSKRKRKESFLGELFDF